MQNSASAGNRALAALWALFWLLMIVVSYQDNADDHGIRWWEPLLWEGTSALVGTAWLLVERRSAGNWAHYLDRPVLWFGRHAAWLPVVAVSFVVGIYALRHAVYAFTGEIYEHESWGFILVYESIKLLLFSALWLCIIFGLESFARWREERERLLALQKTLAESQLAQLRAQLQPHFLFNALNTISALMQSDVERADRLLARLADLLRASLAAGSRQMTTLREEIQLLALYASIMQERFEGRVTLEWRVAADTLEAAVPAMLLQPLLENAYKHGVERSTSPVHIDVSARRAGDSLLIGIRNSAPGDAGVSAGSRGTGIGLLNCRERLALIYGDKARLDLVTDDGAVTAALVLPWQGLPR